MVMPKKGPEVTESYGHLAGGMSEKYTTLVLMKQLIVNVQERKNER